MFHFYLTFIRNSQCTGFMYNRRKCNLVNCPLSDARVSNRLVKKARKARFKSVFLMSGKFVFVLVEYMNAY